MVLICFSKLGRSTLSLSLEQRDEQQKGKEGYIRQCE